MVGPRRKWRRPSRRELSDACKTTIHAARSAVRRYKSGIIPKESTPGLAPKTVRNVHALIHRAFADAVAWKYMSSNPANNVKPPRPNAPRGVGARSDPNVPYGCAERSVCRLVRAGTDHRDPPRPGLRAQMDSRRPRRRRGHRAGQSGGRRRPREGQVKWQDKKCRRSNSSPVSRSNPHAATDRACTSGHQLFPGYRVAGQLPFNRGGHIASS
jgi:hypothetical protein